MQILLAIVLCVEMLVNVYLHYVLCLCLCLCLDTDVVVVVVVVVTLLDRDSVPH